MNDKSIRVYEYLLQVVLIYVVVVTSLFNLTFEIGNVDLWKYLLLTFLGYFLPNPTVRHSKIGHRSPSVSLDHDPLTDHSTKPDFTNTVNATNQ